MEKGGGVEVGVGDGISKGLDYKLGSSDSAKSSEVTSRSYPLPRVLVW